MTRDSSWKNPDRPGGGYGHGLGTVSVSARQRRDEPRRFRYLTDGLFLTGCTVYGINRWLILPHIAARGWWRGHFNDLWLIPCALPPLLWLHRRLGWRGDSAPTWLEIGGHWILWSLACEALGPWLLRKGTADWQDILVYATGALASGVWWRRGH